MMLGLSCLLLGAQAQAVTTELPEGAVVWVDDLHRAVDKSSTLLVQEVWQVLDLGHAQRAVEILQGQSSPLQRELAAAEVLQRLQAGMPRHDVDDFLDWAAAQPVLVFRQHEETRAAAFLPMFDIAQQSRDLRRLWAEAEARDGWAAQWTADPGTALKAAVMADASGQTRAGEALQGLGESGFHEAVAQLAAAGQGEVPAALWLAAAQREPTAARLQPVFERGDAAQRQQALRLTEQLPLEQAVPLLAALEQDAGLGSAATLTLVPRLMSAGKLDEVAARLSDPGRRDSTAAALARLASDPALAGGFDALHRTVAKSTGQGGWRRVLLLLDDPDQRKRWALPQEDRP